MSYQKSRILGIFGIVIIIAFWYAIALSHMFNRVLVPTPLEAFSTLGLLLLSGSLASDIALTLYRMTVAFGFATLLGIPAGLAIGYFRNVYSMFQPIVDFFRSIPATALFPLFILFFGINDMSVFAAAAFGSSFLITLNSMYGVQNANKSRILAAKTMNATQSQIFRKIVFYDAMPYIFVGLRQAISISLIIVIVTEMFFGSGNGLGYRIFNFQLLYESPSMYAVIILVGIIGYAINLVFIQVERKVVHWAGK